MARGVVPAPRSASEVARRVGLCRPGGADGVEEGEEELPQGIPHRGRQRVEVDDAVLSHGGPLPAQARGPTHGPRP
jgi:hypothetical protein